ncbi:phytanoyl-CoA dioxygenase [Verrucomicrobia bacterium LW23]|nr:phytanoyl-CoA dioxygenase [Verrucomicrobia bacterium LW23]
MITLQSDIDLQALKADYDREGYVVVRGMYSPEEVEELKAEFERIHDELPEKAHDDGIRNPDDPLYKYPRIVHPHRYSNIARKHMIHPRVREVLHALFGEEPVATQTMYYFKPPGARGQALHQDNLYLLVQPGTCMAAWTAIDRVDRENGGMMVVPKTHTGNLLCQEKADENLRKESFSHAITRVPKGHKPIDVPMEPGDTLFFGGSTIHGSGPNRSKDRFRRSFIGHYAAGSLEKISKFYLPLVRMDGTDCEVEAAAGGGACGNDWIGGLH